MEDSSSNIVQKRFLPRLKIPRNNDDNDMLMELRKSFFWPTVRTKRSITLVYFFGFLLASCTVLFLFGNSPSARLKTIMLNNKSRISTLFRDHPIFYWNLKEPSKIDNNKGSINNATKKEDWLEMMKHCDIYDGKWVKDENSPPLYEPGSCPIIDESFDCYRSGRPDDDHVKLRWQPKHCTIPRLDGGKMLKFFTGKRIVYVGDSLNRNMWESMVCILRNSAKDKKRVFEASGKIEFKKQGTYSFLFPDYNISVEYIRSAFLVQEWEMEGDNGSKKETLRLDVIDNSYHAYKNADILIFNTGNWWTHEKTSQGKGYYQEGNHVHKQLDVVEAFDKAMGTWARWIETNINPLKTHVFFRGYSFSHFSKGEWNTGGRCDDYKEPTKHVKDLLSIEELSPPIPQMLDKLVERVRIPLYYLNVTRMTNYRRDAHPSIYRKPNMSEEEKSIQDCSHWCLPGVPDTWNQLMFAQVLFTHKWKHIKVHNHPLN